MTTHTICGENSLRLGAGDCDKIKKGSVSTEELNSMTSNPRRSIAWFICPVNGTLLTKDDIILFEHCSVVSSSYL